MGAGLIISNLISGWFSDWQEKRKQKRDIAKAVTENKIELAKSKETHNQNWEMRQLENQDELLRRFSFFMFSAPFFVAIFSPESVNEYFTVALSSMPDWYVKAFFLMLAAIWGLSEYRAGK